MSEKQEKIAMGIFAVSLVGIIILIGFIAVGGLTGRVIQENQADQAAESASSCFDSDAQDFFTKGSVKLCENENCVTREDSCSNNRLTEYYCDGSEVKTLTKDCNCDDGACVNLVTDYKYLGGSSGAGGGGGGGGSSGGGGETTTQVGQTYNLGELTSEQSVEAGNNDIIKFTAGQEYSLGISGLTATQLSLQGNVIVVGNEYSLDLNSDSINDIYAKAKSISIVTGKAKLILGKI